MAAARIRGCLARNLESAGEFSRVLTPVIPLLDLGARLIDGNVGQL